MEWTARSCRAVEQAAAGTQLVFFFNDDADGEGNLLEDHARLI